MARLLPWLLFAAALAALAVALWRPDEVGWRLGLGERLAARQDAVWERRLRAHYRRLDGSTPAGAVVFLGASSIQGLNASAVRSCTASFGIGGETADELAERVGDYRALDRAAAVVVMTGLNDVLRGDGAAVGPAVRRLLAALPPGVPVILSSTVRLADPTRGAALAPVNVAMRDACRADPRCRFVDLAAAMADPVTLIEPDGIHLNPAGYALWARLLREALDGTGVADRACATGG